MEKITEKILDFLDALKTLEDILKVFYEYKALFAAHPTEKNEQFFVIVRDATIRRFAYCTDLIWKVLKVYLEDIKKVHVESFSPRGVIREAVNSGFISELESSELIRMVDSRNKTSHIYHATIADDIASKVPEYYSFMRKIIDRMQAMVIQK
ncbi:MAG TPA: HI0074 family nucleotidyltransferase substrate-binding subunit [Candidatus Babeliales bacterium]|jgi:nucleotidyltransferase substrate binding protein (TIGR01987 family)|nr:HI0074 family nucleotidyltransferase substrate-binding subunit [Candidatus Babeliales bacterium]